MAEYRLYHVRGGRFVGCTEFEAEDDAQASSCAAGLVHGEAAELWCGGRKVRDFKAAER